MYVGNRSYDLTFNAVTAGVVIAFDTLLIAV